VSADLSLVERSFDATGTSQDFEAESKIVGLSWRPTSRLGLSATFQEAASVADVAVFGRDSTTRSSTARASYRRDLWYARYSFDRSVFENPGAFRAEQDRHEIRFEASRGFFSDRFSLGFFSTVSQLERRDQVGEGGELVEPVPARNGLFAVDTSPEIGELAMNPGLIDGDLVTPAAPGIDIGGGATYRNLGLDLGISTQVTRLEITVNTLTGPAVVWQVFQSPDNLVWIPVTGVVPFFDEALLRYTLVFPQITSRFVKAVNVSPNSEAVVRVTELRALVDVDRAAPEATSDSTRYRTRLGAAFQPSDRVTINADIGGSNDEDVSEGLVRREYRDLYGSVRMAIELPKALDLNLSYRYEDVEDLREPALLRTVDTYSANLRWRPMPTLDAVLRASRREELEESDPLQLVDTLTLQVTIELLPGLRLTTDVLTSELVDQVSRLSRTAVAWEERITAQVTQNWSVGGRFQRSEFESEEFPLQTRQSASLDSSWRVSPFLSLIGSWTWIDDDIDDFLQQSYNIAYGRGKLTLTGGVQTSESRGIRSTRVANANARYTLNRQVQANLAFTTSRSEGLGSPTAESTTLRASLRVTF
jgi:hypothetical protein